MSAEFDREAAKKFLLSMDDALSGRFHYFLIGGTALGAWRDKDFPPFERDIDVGLLLHEDDKFVMDRVARLLMVWGFEVNTWNRHKRDGSCHTIVAQRWGIHADIVGWSLARDRAGSFKRYAQAPRDVDPHYCIVHDAEQIERWQPAEMFGRTFNVPSPIERYLELEYGPEWRTPKDDHVSRTRVYGFLESEVPEDGR